MLSLKAKMIYKRNIKVTQIFVCVTFLCILKKLQFTIKNKRQKMPKKWQKILEKSKKNALEMLELRFLLCYYIRVNNVFMRGEF